MDVDSDDTHTVTINWGDGNSLVLTTADLTLVGTQYTLPALNHVYVDDGSYTITVTVQDAEGATASRTQTITVNNVPPLIADAAGTPLGNTLALPPGQEDTPIVFGLRGIDPGVSDVLQWSIISGPSQGTVTILPPWLESRSSFAIPRTRMCLGQIPSPFGSAMAMAALTPWWLTSTWPR